VAAAALAATSPAWFAVVGAAGAALSPHASTRAASATPAS
jgi:hypothetical protein